jgi:hypothetical protein
MKYKNGKNEVSILVYLAMKSLLVDIGCHLCKMNTCHDSRAYGYKQSGILSRLVGLEWNSNGFGLASMKLYDL